MILNRETLKDLENRGVNFNDYISLIQSNRKLLDLLEKIEQILKDQAHSWNTYTKSLSAKTIGMLLQNSFDKIHLLIRESLTHR